MREQWFAGPYERAKARVLVVTIDNRMLSGQLLLFKRFTLPDGEVSFNATVVYDHPEFLEDPSIVALDIIGPVHEISEQSKN